MPGAGLLLVTHLAAPLGLLWLGHGYRQRSSSVRAWFWGGVVGYLASVVLVTAVLLLPPVFWGAPGGVRWRLIQWTPLLLPLLTASGAGLFRRTGAAEPVRAPRPTRPRPPHPSRSSASSPSR
ncbi:MAG: hypothetical protein RQ751_13885 [Longimicrobiales bacterium]|nr:hypothetical protein [Longimicrobiales bacterium]